VVVSRARNATDHLINGTFVELGLASTVVVDVARSRMLAQGILNDPARAAHAPIASVIGGLSESLLPDWYEAWLVSEAENWRHLRLRALETVAGQLIDSRRYSEAAMAASAARAADPLRETARALLMRVHLAEGNQSEAVREFREYKSLLREELGLTPTANLEELLTRSAITDVLPRSRGSAARLA
jgi:DNA-binding SARP family transcriptional activator